MTMIKIFGEATQDYPISLEYLHRLVLKAIFDEDNMSKSEFHLMEDGFQRWTDYLQGMVIESTVGQEQQISLELYALQLRMNQEGKYEKRKEFFKHHDVDYLKFYKMPGAVSAEDLAKGQYILNEWNAKNAKQELN